MWTSIGRASGTDWLLDQFGRVWLCQISISYIPCTPSQTRCKFLERVLRYLLNKTIYLLCLISAQDCSLVLCIRSQFSFPIHIHLDTLWRILHMPTQSCNSFDLFYCSFDKDTRRISHQQAFLICRCHWEDRSFSAILLYLLQ